MYRSVRSWQEKENGNEQEHFYGHDRGCNVDPT